ncbi:T9SS type A sorting domain-containing protein [Mesonia maritima]|uniref:Secretion system C-terminal sorting domain-containing protein n=1 Tax=Mesonia maritima TaxID=1793873 RepID=A0ABU1K8L6_9FLAO|nr:T9SS type A sorting domain-containing protein [Mesonia maritima]MDR6300842.1 hypothetical protein [Mesonia maritima]
MKKTTLLFVLILLAFSINAQNNFTYNFSATNENYADLTNSTSLNNGNYWDDPDFTIPIGFDFEIAGKTLSTIYFSEDIGYGGEITDQQIFETEFMDFAVISNDIEDRGTESPNSSLSNISYTVEGNSGNRIFKLEWNNAGFLNDGTNQDFINMQLWLYEGSNIIEYRYGPSSIENPSESYEGNSGPTAFLLLGYDGNLEETSKNVYMLSGDPASPTVTEIASGNELDLGYLNNDIPNGTVYRFTPENLSNESFQLAAISLYPNPVEEKLNIKTSQIISSFSIYNALGQVITENTEIEKNTIDVSTLAEGIYFIKMETENGTSSTKKFIKK